MDKAGVRAGDFLEAADGYPLNGAANWFLARAHFERDRPIELHLRRGEQQSQRWPVRPTRLTRQKTSTTGVIAASDGCTTTEGQGDERSGFDV